MAGADGKTSLDSNADAVIGSLSPALHKDEPRPVRLRLQPSSQHLPEEISRYSLYSLYSLHGHIAYMYGKCAHTAYGSGLMLEFPLLCPTSVSRNCNASWQCWASRLFPGEDHSPYLSLPIWAITAMTSTAPMYADKCNHMRGLRQVAS